MELCRLGDKLHLDGMESMPVMQAKKKVVHAVIPGMRLDGKSKAYINAAFDIARVKSMVARLWQTSVVRCSMLIPQMRQSAMWARRTTLMRPAIV